MKVGRKKLKIIKKKLVFLKFFYYLYYMRERLIALIVFLMVTDHPCRFRVTAIELEPLPKSEISFKPE